MRQQKAAKATTAGTKPTANSKAARRPSGARGGTKREKTPEASSNAPQAPPERKVDWNLQRPLPPTPLSEIHPKNRFAIEADCERFDAWCRAGIARGMTIRQWVEDELDRAAGLTDLRIDSETRLRYVGLISEKERAYVLNAANAWGTKYLLVFLREALLAYSDAVLAAGQEGGAA